MNEVKLKGNIGQDLQLRYAKSGAPWCTLSVATTTSKKVGEEWQKTTEWHNVVCFGKTAENLNLLGTKGDTVFVQGALQTTVNPKNSVKYTKIMAKSIDVIKRSETTPTRQTVQNDVNQLASQKTIGNTHQYTTQFENETDTPY